MPTLSDRSDAILRTLSPEEVYGKLDVTETGLTEAEVHQRQALYGKNTIHKRHTNFLTILVRQITGNPLLLVLSAATTISYLLGQHVSSYYIFGIIIASILLGVWNEYSAAKTIDNLLKKISATAIVMRGEKKEIPAPELTIGDIVYLSEGSVIPADVRFIQALQLEIDESALTGESKTVYKSANAIVHQEQHESQNIGFMGTHVQSGSGVGVVIRIGKETAFGKIAKSTTFVKPITEFQKGLSGFSRLIINVILILTVGIFIVNALLGHRILESLLFALAIAVGLTPELLPVIVTVCLAHGAGKLAKKHVVTKQLVAIENLGNMDILCTDKTGTLTEGNIQVVDYLDIKKEKDELILKFALSCNSAIVHHRIIGNAIDVALWTYAKDKHLSHSLDSKVFEEPFDYQRRLQFVVTSHGKDRTLIVKGSPEAVLSICSGDKDHLKEEFTKLSNDGYRVIALATKSIGTKQAYTWNDVEKMHFIGYITFLDTPKTTAKEALVRLHNLHVMTKVVTGDDPIITQKICREVGMDDTHVLTGLEMDRLSDHALKEKAVETTIFARVSPDQKLRIIQTLQNLGHTVGYMGDGINDIPSLHAADVGISVNTAIDVAKDAASIVLLRKSLNVLADGITEGRKTFANTIKYILMSTSSNFGNMFSAAGASFLLPFLPMTPLQVLLTNSLYDVSQISIPTDNVDPESLLKPRHWDVSFIKHYMLFFGPLSSIFDFLTFGILYFVFHARGATFQTGWFVESVATEILVVFVIRTSRTPFFLSRPSFWLCSAALTMVALGCILPLLPFAHLLGFTPMPLNYYLTFTILVITYLILVEIVKNSFLKKYNL
jgi:Mg2+-importing ATPase